MSQRNLTGQPFPLRTQRPTSACARSNINKSQSSKVGVSQLRIVSLRISSLHDSSANLRKIHVVLSIGNKQAFRTPSIESSSGVYCWEAPSRLDDCAICAFNFKGFTNLHQGSPLMLDVFLSEYPKDVLSESRSSSCQRLGEFSLELKPMKYFQPGNFASLESTKFLSDLTFEQSRVPRVVLEAAWSPGRCSPQKAICARLCQRRDLWPKKTESQLPKCNLQGQVAKAEIKHTQDECPVEVEAFTDMHKGPDNGSGEDETPEGLQQTHPHRFQELQRTEDEEQAEARAYEHAAVSHSNESSRYGSKSATMRKIKSLHSIHNEKWAWSSPKNKGLSSWARKPLAPGMFKFEYRRLSWCQGEDGVREVNVRSVTPQTMPEGVEQEEVRPEWATTPPPPHGLLSPQLRGREWERMKLHNWHWSCPLQFSSFCANAT